MSAGAQVGIFQGKGGGAGGVIKAFWKTFRQEHKKKGPQRIVLEFFLLDNLKTIFWMKHLTQRWSQSGLFFPKSGNRFRFSKRSGEASSLSFSCAFVSEVEYASISLNIPKHPWKCLNKLFWLCQGSEYAWSFGMFSRLLTMPRVLN